MSLKLYEIARLGLEPFLPPLYKIVRSRLREMLVGKPSKLKLLDVGGRKSPYTIGLPADVTIIDLPRNSQQQKDLNLGINNQILTEIKKRRSNIENVVIGDITSSDLPSNSFDFVISVEVLEHVVEDELFVKEVCRVLKPGGVFLMTTPNGDWLKNTNPDHVRHYKREELFELLARHMNEVQVDYSIAGGRFRKYGLRPWSITRPIVTASSIVGNVVNSIQSASKLNSTKAHGTHHLIATAKK